MTPSICAMMVTYGNRAQLCTSVAERLVELGVSRILIVDNASPPVNHAALKALAARHQQVTVITNDENLGSGGGFRRALEAAFLGQEEFFFLLDDDNLPHPDCLGQLLTAHKFLESDHKGIILYANRGSTRQTDTRAFRDGFTKSYPVNSFCSFVLRERTWGRFKRFGRRAPNTHVVNYPIVRVHYGPYGGMFGRKAVFAQIGLPREDYFLYADDHEYATRMERQQISQFLIEPARVTDLDVSFQPGYFLLSPELSAMRVYYQIRNHTHLSQSFIERRSVYRLNKYSFVAWETLKGCRVWAKEPSQTLDRWRLLRQAISDGESGRLGRTYCK